MLPGDLWAEIYINVAVRSIDRKRQGTQWWRESRGGIDELAVRLNKARHSALDKILASGTLVARKRQKRNPPAIQSEER